LGAPITVEQERHATAGVLYDSPTIPWDDPLTLWDAGSVGVSTRFVGRVAGITAVERGGPVLQYEVRCVGGQAALGRRHVLITRPAETELQRVAAIAAAAGVTIQTVGAAQVDLAADTVDQDALSAIHQVCESTAGLFWQDRSGGFWYGTGVHREVEPTRVIPECAILDGLEWSQSVEAIINHVTVTYGPEAAQAQTTQSDPASITTWGMRHADANTVCATQTEADQLALYILVRRSQPFWSMPGVMVPMDDLGPIDFDVVQDAEVSTAVLVPISTDPGTLPAPVRDWVVEGWVETYDIDAHWMQLSLSDRDRYGATGHRDWTEAKTFNWTHEKTLTWLTAMVEAT
jgi:hypothetical protein